MKGILHIDFIGFRGEYNPAELEVTGFVSQAVERGELNAGDIVFFNSPNMEAKSLTFSSEGSEKKSWRLAQIQCVRVYCLYLDFPMRLRQVFRRLEHLKGHRVYFIFLSDESLMPQGVRQKLSEHKKSD